MFTIKMNYCRVCIQISFIFYRSSAGNRRENYGGIEESTDKGDDWR